MEKGHVKCVNMKFFLSRNEIEKLNCNSYSRALDLFDAKLKLFRWRIHQKVYETHSEHLGGPYEILNVCKKNILITCYDQKHNNRNIKRFFLLKKVSLSSFCSVGYLLKNASYTICVEFVALIDSDNRIARLFSILGLI